MNTNIFVDLVEFKIPGAYLSLEFGSKHVILVAYLGSSVLTILIPLFANLNKIYLIICRFLIGIFQGVIWPSFAGLWVSWVPIRERGRLIGIAYAGSQIGNAITLPMGNVFCRNGFYGSWPNIFFVIGIIGFFWLFIWLWFASDTPEKSRYISHKEREYLEAELSDPFSIYERLSIPWWYIIKSKPCMALFVGHACSKLGSYLLLESLPLYIREILEFDDISDNALFAMPYLLFWFFTVCSGVISDYLVIFVSNRTNIRKLFHFLSFFVPMVATFGLIFVTCTLKTLGIVFISVCLAFTGCAYGAGLFVSYNDISGPFASITFAIGNTFGSISGILAPFMVELMHKHEEWFIEYGAISIMYFVGGAVLLLFSSADLRTWAVKQPRERRTSKYNSQMHLFYI